MYRISGVLLVKASGSPNPKREDVEDLGFDAVLAWEFGMSIMWVKHVDFGRIGCKMLRYRNIPFLQLA